MKAGSAGIAGGADQQPVAAELAVERGAQRRGRHGGDALGGAAGGPPGGVAGKGLRPEGAAGLAARRLQRPAGGGRRPGLDPLDRLRIQPRRSHGEMRQAQRLRQRIGQRPEAAFHAVAVGAEIQADRLVAQRIGEFRGLQRPGTLGQQGGSHRGGAFLPRRVQRGAAAPGPGQRDDGHGMVLD